MTEGPAEISAGPVLVEWGGVWYNGNNSENLNLTKECDSMKKAINTFLVFAVIIPIVLLFWPFATWYGIMALILRIVPAIAVQALVYRICKSNIVRAIPALLTGTFAAWGTYLFFTSPHWSNATAGDLIADYVSPFIGCIVVLLACLLTKKKN